MGGPRPVTRPATAALPRSSPEGIHQFLRSRCLSGRRRRLITNHGVCGRTMSVRSALRRAEQSPRGQQRYHSGEHRTGSRPRLMRRVHERRRRLAGEINQGHRTTRTVRSVVAPTPVRAACVGSRSPSPLTILGEDTPWHSVAAGSAVERRTRRGDHSPQCASDARPAGPVRELA